MIKVFFRPVHIGFYSSVCRFYTYIWTQGLHLLVFLHHTIFCAIKALVSQYSLKRMFQGFYQAKAADSSSVNVDAYV